MPRHVSSFACLLFALCFFLTPTAHADDAEIWWGSAVKDAEEDGYKLIDTKELAALLKADSDVLILDVRADYEHEAGRLPGASNLEFDLGDRIDLPEDKRKAFIELVGPDKKRQLVIYCRSFR
ncbi:rhodanese-like domain-containing protein [Pseudodesulfovibrio sp. zrk46]|nr:rhodanese-like domain-containing protein [Pseudodesulfovibrio sp. zrk46]